MENKTLNDNQNQEKVPFVPANEAGENIMRQALHFNGPDPDTIPYLLLIARSQDEHPDSIDIRSYDGLDKDWGIMIGRQATYDFIKYEIENNGLDPDKSFIIAMPCEKLSAVPRVSQFMKHMKESGKVFDHTEFNIDDYHLYTEDDDENDLPSLLEIWANGDISDNSEDEEDN